MAKKKFPLTCHLPIQERLEMLENIFYHVAEAANISGVVNHLDPRRGDSWEEAFIELESVGEDSTFRLILHCLQDSNDNMTNFFQKILSQLTTEQLGAKKATIDWR